jgi:type I restriction enzyme M protein
VATNGYRDRVISLGSALVVRAQTGIGQKRIGRLGMPKMQNNRPNLFDFVQKAQRESTSNKFCKKTDLSDESSVEDFFVMRLLKDLEYNDSEIKPKKALAKITIPAGGRKKENYRPDYAIVCTGKPRWLIEAKASDQDIDKWAYQGSGYALELNKQFTGENPVQYYVLTNGLALKVWKWDEQTPALSLSFHNFTDDDPQYLALQSILSSAIVRKEWNVKTTKPDEMVLRRPSVEEVKRLFKSCHNLIWKSEKMSPQPAFFEFVKIMFVKLWEDRKLHDDPELGPLINDGNPIPVDRVVFSTKWIDSLEAKGVENPVDGTLFEHLVQTLKEGVAKGKKKPIFEDNERIRLHQGTIKQVVSKMENFDMFGIDEDLNGRLFETFLSATMRGEALGQYFTPRSIVKLMECIAHPTAQRGNIDRVIDACCGTGGFLIEALTDMRNQVRENQSLTPKEASALLEKIANQSIVGVDAGQDPPLARIARVNMYLHGDGGSRIYAADSLDKSVSTSVGTSPEAKLELEELKRILDNEKGGGFDIVLTNPPFSMGYSSNLPDEEAILRQYDLMTFGHSGTSKRRQSLTSRAMFIERYYDLLKPGGKLITVIDDATLSTKTHSYVRDFIREKFIIRAVISLPGDAFQRVGARAKTSVLYLVKRKPGEKGQPDVFMMESSYIGLDDVPMKTPKSKADEARALAEEESRQIIESFNRFMVGKKGPYVVSSARITDRLDVKSCLPRTDDISKDWLAEGLEVLPLQDIVENITSGGINPKDSPDEKFTFLRIKYDGLAEEGETRLGKEMTYTNVIHPAENNIVVSNIAMALGAASVLPKDLAHTVASSEFTILRVTDKRFDPWYLCGYLRSSEVRARLLSTATGISRHCVSWDFLKDLPVPLVDSVLQRTVSKHFQSALTKQRQADKDKDAMRRALSEKLGVENDWALKRLRAAKPPK